MPGSTALGASRLPPGHLHQLLPKVEGWGATGIIARIETRPGRQGHPRLTPAHDCTGPQPQAACHRQPVVASIGSLPRLAQGGPHGRRTPDGAGLSSVRFCRRVGRLSLVRSGAEKALPNGSPRPVSPATSFRCPPPYATAIGPENKRSWADGSKRSQAGGSAGLRRRSGAAGSRGLPRAPPCRCPTTWRSSAWTTTSCCASCPIRRCPAWRGTEKAGYEAAALLSGLMSGRIGQSRRILVEPTHVVGALFHRHSCHGRPLGGRRFAFHSRPRQSAHRRGRRGASGRRLRAVRWNCGFSKSSAGRSIVNCSRRVSNGPSGC